MLRCPLTYAANGQQHSSSYCVCNPQHHGVVQGGALASATGGPVSARYLPLSLFPTKTKEMRITRANHLAERIKITSFSLSQMMASMMAAVTIIASINPDTRGVPFSIFAGPSKAGRPGRFDPATYL